MLLEIPSSEITDVEIIKIMKSRSIILFIFIIFLQEFKYITSRYFAFQQEECLFHSLKFSKIFQIVF